MKVRKTNSDQKPNIALVKFQTKPEWALPSSSGGGPLQGEEEHGKEGRKGERTNRNFRNKKFR